MKYKKPIIAEHTKIKGIIPVAAAIAGFFKELVDSNIHTENSRALTARKIFA